MKNLISFLFLAAIFSTSCKKEDAKVNNPTTPTNPTSNAYTCNECVTCIGKYSNYYHIKYDQTTGDSIGIDTISLRQWINKDCNKRKPYVKCNRLDYCPYYIDVEILYEDKNGKRISIKP